LGARQTASEPFRVFRVFRVKKIRGLSTPVCGRDMAFSTTRSSGHNKSFIDAECAEHAEHAKKAIGQSPSQMDDRQKKPVTFFRVARQTLLRTISRIPRSLRIPRQKKLVDFDADTRMQKSIRHAKYRTGKVILTRNTQQKITRPVRP
jgi:hypothetical protein